MREIEFRGQQINTNQWIYGYLYRNKGLYVICENIRYAEEEPILLDTIGQYTGLKDKNGKKIYEGDILEWEDGFGIHHDIVVWDEYEWALQYGQEQKWVRSIFTIYYDAEVIGNVWDNPELIDKSK